MKVPHTPAQLADISAAFEGLSEETKGKFEECYKCNGNGYYYGQQSERPRIECSRCCGLGRIPTSDTAMAVLFDAGYYSLHISPRAVMGFHSGRFTPINDKQGSSPLHCLLLAFKAVESLT